MTIHIYKDVDTQSQAAAGLFAAQILQKPDCVLGFATGSTPLGTYAALIDLYKRGIADFSTVRTFNLDEYVGMSRTHEQSYYRFMVENLFDQVNIPKDNYRLPDGMAKDLNAECAGYERAIDDAGGIDLLLLGIGLNSHIGFNEPEARFSDGTHVVDLTESTIEANKRFFATASEVPRQAISMGIGSIMRARAIALVINGAAKADITKQALQGPVVPDVPGSILRFHPNVTVLLDEAAASKL